MGVGGKGVIPALCDSKSCGYMHGGEEKTDACLNCITGESLPPYIVYRPINCAGFHGGEKERLRLVGTWNAFHAWALA